MVVKLTSFTLFSNTLNLDKDEFRVGRILSESVTL